MQATWPQQPLGGHRSRASVGGVPGEQGWCPTPHISQGPDFLDDWGALTGMGWRGEMKL